MFRQDVVCRRGNYEREPFGVPGGSPASDMNGGWEPSRIPTPRCAGVRGASVGVLHEVPRDDEDGTHRLVRRGDITQLTLRQVGPPNPRTA